MPMFSNNTNQSFLSISYNLCLNKKHSHICTNSFRILSDFSNIHADQDLIMSRPQQIWVIAQTNPVYIWHILAYAARIITRKQLQ